MVVVTRQNFRNVAGLPRKEGATVQIGPDILVGGTRLGTDRSRRPPWGGLRNGGSWHLGWIALVVLGPGRDSVEG